MNLLFFGSDLFALPSLAALLDSKHRVLDVVTQPDKPAGRGQQLHPCPVANLAREQGLPLFQPSSLKGSDAIDHLRAHNADAFVIVAYGKFLPSTFFTLPPKGCINVHPSLLPRYRGPAPMTWAIANGDKETGVTTMYITEEMDAGDMIFVARTAIDECEKAPQLEERLAVMGADLLLKTLDAIEKGTAPRIPQDHIRMTLAPLLTKEDGHIDWTMPAQTIYNRVRAFQPWPGTYALWEGKRLHIHEAAVISKPATATTGSVMERDGTLSVATGEGLLYLLEVQLEGKKQMSTAAFLRGHRIQVGTVFT